MFGFSILVCYEPFLILISLVLKPSMAYYRSLQEALVGISFVDPTSLSVHDEHKSYAIERRYRYQPC